MSIAHILALFFTVALLVTTTYFLLGSAPLLILKHDTPKDSRFVRGFFGVYYIGAITSASAAAVCYALAEKPALAAGAAGLAVAAIVARRKVTAKMDELGSQIQEGGLEVIPEFRRTHVYAILFNLAQLVLIVWSLAVFSPR